MLNFFKKTKNNDQKTEGALFLAKAVKVNPAVFNTDVKQLPIRDGFGEGLVIAAERNSQVVGLCADLVESTRMLDFKKKFPERFIEIGVSEQNMASVASGMAAMGKIPFLTSYAMFSPGRNWEQIRTTLCYNDRKAIIVGSHAGVSVGPDGGTHQAIEDIAITRVIPNMAVIVPCDAIEAKKATIAATLSKKEGGVDTSVYIRLAREKTPIITNEETPFQIGKAQIFYEVGNESGESNRELGNDFAKASEGKKIHHDVGIIACGALVHTAMLAARTLTKEGIAVKVMNLSTIKPIDTEAVVALAKETGALVTVEEHQIIGGLGSAVAECLVSYTDENVDTDSVSKPALVPIEFIGIHDKFGQSGTPAELIKEYGMTETDIKNAVYKVLKRKAIK